METYTMNWGDVPTRGTPTRCCRNTTPHWMFRDDFGECRTQTYYEGRNDQRNPACNSHDGLLTSPQAPVAELVRVQTLVRILTNPATMAARYVVLLAALNQTMQWAARSSQLIDSPSNLRIGFQRRCHMRFDSSVDHKRTAAAPVFCFCE